MAEEPEIAEQEATDELCNAIDLPSGDENLATIETRLILPSLARLTFDDLQYVASKIDTYRTDVQSVLEQKREERLKELQERIERDKAEFASLSPVPVSAGKGKMKNPATPKYRDPAKPENTWAGRGNRPHWLEREIAAGKKLEDFLIENPVPVPEDTGF